MQTNLIGSRVTATTTKPNPKFKAQDGKDWPRTPAELNEPERIQDLIEGTVAAMYNSMHNSLYVVILDSNGKLRPCYYESVTVHPAEGPYRTPPVQIPIAGPGRTR